MKKAAFSPLLGKTPRMRNKKCHAVLAAWQVWNVRTIAATKWSKWPLGFPDYLPTNIIHLTKSKISLFSTPLRQIAQFVLFCVRIYVHKYGVHTNFTFCSVCDGTFRFFGALAVWETWEWSISTSRSIWPSRSAMQSGQRKNFADQNDILSF